MPVLDGALEVASGRPLAHDGDARRVGRGGRQVEDVEHAEQSSVVDAGGRLGGAEDGGGPRIVRRQHPHRDGPVEDLVVAVPQVDVLVAAAQPRVLRDEVEQPVATELLGCPHDCPPRLRTRPDSRRTSDSTSETSLMRIAHAAPRNTASPTDGRDHHAEQQRAADLPGDRLDAGLGRAEQGQHRDHDADRDGGREEGADDHPGRARALHGAQPACEQPPREQEAGPVGQRVGQRDRGDLLAAGARRDGEQRVRQREEQDAESHGDPERRSRVLEGVVAAQQDVEQRERQQAQHEDGDDQAHEAGLLRASRRRSRRAGPRRRRR